MEHEDGGVAPNGRAVPERGVVDPLTLFKPHPQNWERRWRPRWDDLRKLGVYHRSAGPRTCCPAPAATAAWS